MKKIWAVLIAAVLLGLSLGACQSTLGPALELEQWRKEIHELDIPAILDEENGYHFPDLKWDIHLDEVQKITRQGVTSISGLNEDGDIIYTAQYLMSAVGGRKNDDAQVSTTADDHLNLVMLVFNNKNITAADMQQSELYDLLSQKLKDAFGEPDETMKHTDDLNEGYKADIDDMIWYHGVPDGRVTKMIFSRAFVSYSSEPDYISLAFQIGSGK